MRCDTTSRDLTRDERGPFMRGGHRPARHVPGTTREAWGSSRRGAMDREARGPA